MRGVISAVFVSSAAASLVHDCKSGLNQLQGQSDFELAASCRAAFAPATCREVSKSLGPQPWSNDRIEESCAKFSTSFDGMDMRSLEQSLAAKVPLDGSAKSKAHVPASKPPQKKGLVGNLLDKLKEGQKHDQGKQGPLAKLFGEKEQDKPGPLAKLFGKHDEQPAKPGPLAKLFGDKGDKNKPAQPGPLAKLLGDKGNKDKPGPLAKLFGDKDKPGPLAKLFGDKDKSGEKPDLATLLGKHSSRLYSASEVESEPRSLMPAPVGVMMAAAASVAAASAVLFIVRRSRTDSASHPILNANGVEERCVE